MSSDALFGAGIVLLGGILQGLFAAPMKLARKWNYENIWLVFAFSGLVVFPWLLTLATVPHLGEIYRLAPSRTLLAIIGFGVAWGAGATLTGLGLNMLGISLGLAIVLGLSASVGSLVPLLILTPSKLGTPQGHLYLLGTAVMLTGIAVAARAGSLRDAAAKPVIDSDRVSVQGSFLTGMAVTIAAGLLSSTLNFSYAFGEPALDVGRQLSVPAVWVPNVVAALATSGGFVANCVYCCYLLRKNSSARKFGQGSAWNWVYGALMGAFWFGGLAVYGVGVYRMGTLGTVIGWPLLMGTIIVTSNAAGLLTGEWAGADKRTAVWLGTGMVIILLAIWVFALAQQA
jgi:L-rhamnose-H+ transport protein